MEDPPWLWQDNRYEGSERARSCLPQKEEECLTALLAVATPPSSSRCGFPRDVAVTLRLFFVSRLDRDESFCTGDGEAKLAFHIPLVNQFDIRTMTSDEAQELLRCAVRLQSLPAILLFMQQPRADYPQLEDAMKKVAGVRWRHLDHLLRRLSVTEWLKVVSPATLLTAAAAAGMVPMVEQLLVASDAPDLVRTDRHHSPLHAATINRRVEVLRILLSAGIVDCNAQDAEERTPLHLAARYGHVDVARLLLSTDKVDCDAQDDCGRTPLHVAASWGRAGVVRLLLSSEKVDCNARDGDGMTPLHLAAEKGAAGVVRLFLSSDRVDCTAKDFCERTALHAAGGHLEVVRLLLSTGKFDCSAIDADRSTPLHEAASQGGVEVVRLLLASDNADCNAPELNGRTPLYMAAVNGQLEVVRLLLSTDRVDCTAKDDIGRTALHAACGAGAGGIVCLLLSAGKIDCNAHDADGNTALHLAVSKGHWAVVRLLLSTDEVDCNAKDLDDRTPLHVAVSYGSGSFARNPGMPRWLEIANAVIVRLFLLTDKVDCNARDADGRTPLHVAVVHCHLEAVRLLLAYDKVDCNAKQDDGRTALHEVAACGHVEILGGVGESNVPMPASFQGHVEVARLLLSSDKVDCNAKDDVKGRTALHWAAYYGHAEIVNLLLSTEKVDCGAKDSKGKTPLQLVKRKNYPEVAVSLIGAETQSRKRERVDP